MTSVDEPRTAASSPSLVIALVDPPHGTRGGDWYYRAYVPGQALAALPDVHVVHLENNHRARKEIIREADVVVLNAVCDPDLFPVVTERRASGRVTVFEINDDFRAVQASNPVAKFFASAGNRRVLFRLAHLCGASQFTVPELRRLYGAFTPEHGVFANQLPAMPAMRVRDPGGRVVLGWGGSAGHFEDMRHVAPTLTALVRELPELDLHLMGADVILDLFRELPAERVRFVPSGNIDDYHAFVDGLDIGLAPLQNDGFNRSRSDVKFLEYASHGVVPVVQRLEPYLGSVRNGVNGFMFEDVGELAAHVRCLVRDPELRTAVAAGAYASVSSTRLQSLHVEARLAFYARLLEKAGHRPRTPSETESLFRRWRALGGARSEGRFLLLESTDYERHIHTGLVLGQRKGQPREARRHFEAAAALAPTDHLPWLLVGSICEDPTSIAKALELEPRSITARVALGRSFASAGDTRALQLFLSAAELEPTYEAPYAALASFFEHLGHTAHAAEFRAIAAAREAGFDDPKPIA